MINVKGVLKTGFFIHTRNYFFATLVVQAIGFFLLPILTRIMSVEDYGTLEVWRSYTTLFYSVLTFNTYVAIGRYYFEKADDFKEFCGTSFVLIMGLAFFWFLLCIIFPAPIAKGLGLPQNTIIFIAPAVLIGTFTSWFEQIHIPQKMSRAIAIRNVANTLFLLAGAILTIYFLKDKKYLGYIYAQMCTGVIFSIYYYYNLRNYFKITFHWKHLKYIIKYALPLLPYSLSGILLNYFDRIMINKYFGASEAGLYSFAYTIGMLLPTFIGAINRAWMPDYYAYMDDGFYDRIRIKVGKIFSLIGLAALFLVAFGQEIGKILVSQLYFGALEIIPPIVLGYLFFSIYTFYSWNIDYLKKTLYVPLISAISCVTNIFLNFWFFPIFGYKVAAYTTLISYFIMALLGWIISNFVLSFNTVPTLLILRKLLVLIPIIFIIIGVNYCSLNPFFVLIIKVIIFGVYAYNLKISYDSHDSAVVPETGKCR